MQTSIIMFITMIVAMLIVLALMGMCVFCCKLTVWLDDKCKIGIVAVLIVVLLMLFMINFLIATPVCYLIAGGFTW